MKKDKVAAILNLLPDDVEVGLIVFETGDMIVPNPDPQPVPVPVEQGRVIEVTEGESFKKPDPAYHAANPVMTTAVSGWRSIEGERYLAETDPVVGDGGTKWWKLIKGPSTQSDVDQQLVKGYYLNKDKCRKVLA